MILPNIETFIGCESSFEEASIVLYGAPFDSTTSFRPVSYTHLTLPTILRV